MYTKGKQPYEGMRGDEVVTFVENGKYTFTYQGPEGLMFLFSTILIHIIYVILIAGRRLSLPTEANFEVQNIIKCCWEYSPDLRPKFSELLKFFSENPAEYSNLKELLTNQDLGQLGI